MEGKYFQDLSKAPIPQFEDHKKQFADEQQKLRDTFMVGEHENKKQQDEKVDENSQLILKVDNMKNGKDKLGAWLQKNAINQDAPISELTDIQKEMGDGIDQEDDGDYILNNVELKE